MSFSTTLRYYRPTKPPIITGKSLAEFLRSFNRCNVSIVTWPQVVNVKFGEKIDQDEEPAFWDEPVNEIVSQSQELEWDLTFDYQALSDAANRIEQHNRPIYRAWIELGSLSAEIRESIQRVRSPENECDLIPESWSLEIGPIATAGLSSQQLFYVGWMSINIWGYGYLFPWRFADLIERAEKNSAIQQVLDLCRNSWPVKSELPDSRHRSAREQMGEIWPYPEIERAMDWYWGLSEMG